MERKEVPTKDQKIFFIFNNAYIINFGVLLEGRKVWYTNLEISVEHSQLKKNRAICFHFQEIQFLPIYLLHKISFHLLLILCKKISVCETSAISSQVIKPCI